MGKIAQELLETTVEFLAGRGEPVASFVPDLTPSLEARDAAPAAIEALRHLDACAALAEETAGADIARLLADRGQRLAWGRTYSAEEMGESFFRNYGWMELVGTRGHFVSDAIACGFLVLGPNLHYPDHHHEAEEIYIPLTPGTLWKKGDGDFTEREVGEIIHHPSNAVHAMKTGAAPLLALYLWRGGPLAAKSTVSGGAHGE